MNDSESTGRGDRSRRSFLAAAGGGVAAGVALSGCTQLDEVASGDDGDDGDDDDDDEEGDGNGLPGGPNTGTPTDTPMTTTATTVTTTTEPTTTEPAETTTTEPTTTEPTTTEPTTTETTTDRDTSRNKTLQLTTGALSTLDPIQATDTTSEAVIQQIYESLMTHPNGEARVEGQLATDVSVSSDYRTYTFQLNEDAEFHDGSDVTAEDVVYSFERLAASTNSQQTYFVLDYALNVEHELRTTTDDYGNEDEEYVPGSLNVAATGRYEFKMRLAEPFAPALDMLAYSAFAVVPRGVTDDIERMPSGGRLGSDETEFIDDPMLSHDRFARSSPIGSGPFKLDHWDVKQEVEVVRNRNWYGGEAAIRGVFWRVIPDSRASYQYSQNMNADFLTIPDRKYDPGKVDVEGTDDLGRRYGTYGPMSNGRTAQYLEVATINTFYVGFNCENVEKPVRQAFAYAMNQQESVGQVFKGRGKAAYHLTPPNVYPGGAPAYDEHAEENYPYGYDDTELGQAKQIMEDAGYGPDKKYEITFTTYKSPTWQGIGKILRDKLASAHVNVQLEEAPFPTLLSRARDGNIEAYSLGWIVDWPAPDNLLKNVVPEKTNTDQDGGAEWFYMDWDGDDGGQSDAARLASRAWEVVQNNREPTTTAKKRRNEAYVAMEEAMWQDVPLLPVYHRTSERFWYDWVDVPRFGGLGPHRQTFDDVRIGDRDR